MADKVGAKRSFSEVTTSPDNQASMASSSDKIKLYSLATPNGQKVRVYVPSCSSSLVTSQYKTQKFC